MLQLLVEEFVALGPIDTGVRLGKQQPEKVRQVALQRLFPGRIVIVLDSCRHTPASSIRYIDPEKRHVSNQPTLRVSRPDTAGPRLSYELQDGSAVARVKRSRNPGRLLR
jgi:hypothetical protein